MSEKVARHRQYEYRANSNLVLQADRSGPRENEPTGEPESLWGRLTGRFGDRAMVNERDKELEEKLERMRKRARKVEQEQTTKVKPKKKREMEPGSVLQATIDTTTGYRPKTKETRTAYESILDYVQRKLGDEPPDVIRGAGEEILYILKTDDLRALEKKKEIEKLLSVTLNEQDLADLIDLGKKITDYSEETEGAGETIDDELGVAVVFDEEDEDVESEYIIKDDQSDEEDDETTGVETQAIETLEQQANEDEMEEEDPFAIDPRSIHAFWVKGEVSKKVDDDPINSQRISEEILAILENPDDRVCENKLVQLLGYEKFDLIRTLLRNRLKIVWCTKLARAESDEDREKIQDQMKDDAQLAKILERLRQGGKHKDRDFERNLRKEAKAIRSKEKENEGVSTSTILDLDNLVFQQGGHLMSNKKCTLPPGSFRKQKKGYEEVHIPALKAPPFGEDEALVQIADMPEWAQAGFKDMKALNRIQSRVYKVAFQSHENLLLCAPTGAGKTNVAMLCIMRELGLNMDQTTKELDMDNFKIVYIAPMKALVQEMVGNFSKRLASYGISVKELTGDQNLTKQQIKETQIIVTTPEKWDIITRKSGDRTFTQMVRLIIIDEIHLLHDTRGPVLEAIIARTLRQIETTQEHVRLVGLSATLPNYEDVGLLLRVKQECVFAFNNGYRPCPLEQQYIGVTEKKALKRFQLMNEITYEKVMDHAGKSQVLIFVHSRKETVKTARALRDMALANDTLSKFMQEGSASREILQTEADETIKNADLKELLPFGFGVHHAGLLRQDRNLVEDLFGDGHIQVLVSTATLAWGVNLPAHTVIIRGTQIYSPERGEWVELSPMDIMQMLGRAGRPAFDTYGEGIILTGHTELQYYLSLMNQQLPIESQFLSRLPDLLNAEIVLGTVQNVDEAVQWLSYTYLYICMLRNPTLYGITLEEAEEDKYLEKRRRDLIHSAAVLLDKGNLIKYDRKSGSFQVTDLGIVASHYYVTHTSMQTYNEHLKPSLGDIELFRLFALSSEFKYIAVRMEERMEVEKLLEKVPIPVKESIEDGSAKVNILLQAYISRLKLEGFALIADMVYVTQSAARLMRALHEIVLKRGWAQMAEKTLTLCKMVDKRMWSSQSPLRQFNDIPEDVIRKMERKDFPFERLYDLDAQEIGELINFPPMGKKIHKHIHQFPRLELTAHVQPITRQILRIELTITPDFQWEEKYHGLAEAFWITVEDVDQERVLHHEYFVLKKKFAGEEHIVSFTVPLFEPLHPQYFVRVVSDRWIGSETVLPISFRQLLLPEKFPPHTELLDLKPIPLSELKNPQFEKLYADRDYLNPIQTQVFHSVYNSDSNVLICAPTGSGKSLCAEFAILRLFNNDPNARCVYICPNSGILNNKTKELEARFGAGLDKNVVVLTGEATQDLRLLERGNIILSSPEHWDILSRRWKQRKNVQNVGLFIVDELHLLGGEGGPTIELIVSRMRYMAYMTEKKVRIVALSSPIANAKDVADWIGATSHNSFNFHPNARPTALEIHLQGFDIYDFGARMMAMSRPTLYSVAHHGQGKPLIIFVPNRKQARFTAKDLIAFSDPTDKTRSFLHCTKDDLEPFLQHINNKALKEALQFGIGFYHEALTAKEKKVVEHLFSSGAIQIILATHNECWELSVNAFLVIIMGTQYYDGKEHRYADYPIADILQMMGRASRPKIDSIGKCVLYCFGPKKDFYKKFLYEPMPLESHLDHVLADHMNAEAVTKTLENKQDAVDYLTWTFYYRRLTLNPNYYGMQGVSHRHLSDHLSELVESVLSDLEEARCIAIQDEMDISPLNLGIIACYYNIKYTTIELFNSSLSSKIKLKGLIDIIASASEYENIPIRHGEDKILRKLANHLPLKIEKPNFSNAHTKVNVLLQAHFSRKPLTADLARDLDMILEVAIRLLQAIVDVISSNSWLNPALAAMELSQMVTQAVWDSDSIFKQLPHFTPALIEKCKERGVESIYDLMELEDADRNDLLQMSPQQLQDVALVCNRYPNIELTHELITENGVVRAGSTITINVQLEREMEDDEDLAPVHAPYYPKERLEGWWLCLGESKENKLLAIKRLTFGQRTQTKLECEAPAPGDYTYRLFFMCDSYCGCDQEYEVKVHVEPAEV